MAAAFIGPFLSVTAFKNGHHMGQGIHGQLGGGFVFGIDQVGQGHKDFIVFPGGQIIAQPGQVLGDVFGEFKGIHFQPATQLHRHFIHFFFAQVGGNIDQHIPCLMAHIDLFTHFEQIGKMKGHVEVVHARVIHQRIR